MSDTLVIVAHPHLEHSRVTRSLLQAAREAGPAVSVRDLYALYPDYHVDVPAEQQALARARTVVWLHPIHWYSMPPLMKLWVDDVLAFGWAYGPGGRALQGRTLWLVTSTGGGPDAYSAGGHHGHPFEEFLLPYRRTAALIGMRMREPLVLHGAHRATEDALQDHRQQFVAGLRSALSEATEPAATSTTDAGAVGADDRPGQDVRPGPSRP